MLAEVGLCTISMEFVRNVVKSDLLSCLGFLVIRVGELIIQLPLEASHLIVEGRPFRLSIEYSLENPQGGLHFFIPEDPNGSEVFLVLKQA